MRSPGIWHTAVALAAVCASAPQPAFAATCETPTHLEDLSAAIQVYSAYGARVDFDASDLKLRALAVERALECLDTPLKPEHAAEVHRYYALKYYLERPETLDGNLDSWDQAHLEEFGRILDAACKAAGGPQGLKSEAWDGTNIDNVLRHHTCSAVAAPVVPRPATSLILLDGRLPDTVLSPAKAAPTSLLPTIVQRLDRTGTVQATLHIGADAPWPAWDLRSHQAGPLASLAAGATLTIVGLGSMVSGILVRDNFCELRYPERLHDPMTVDNCKENRTDIEAPNALIFGGLGGALTGVGLLVGGSVWLHTQPDGAMIGISRPLK